MGSLFGGYLSKKNEVYLVEVDPAKVAAINENGVCIRESDGTEGIYHPTAVTSTKGLPVMDLVVVFVKAMYTETALEANKQLIGPDTYLMTLQNGAGHEAKLLKFADRQHVIIGSTQHNSSLIGNGHVNHGGGGKSSIGLLYGASDTIINIAQAPYRLRLCLRHLRRGQKTDLGQAVSEHRSQHPDWHLTSAPGLYTR